MTRQSIRTPTATNSLAAPTAQAAQRRGIHGCENYHIDETEKNACPLEVMIIRAKPIRIRPHNGRDHDKGDYAAQDEAEELQAAVLLVDEEGPDDHGEGPAGREGQHRYPTITTHYTVKRLVSLAIFRHYGGDQVREEVRQGGVPDADADPERVLEEAVEAPAAPATAAAAAAEDALEDLDDDAVDDADRGHYHYEGE